MRVASRLTISSVVVRQRTRVFGPVLLSQTLNWKKGKKARQRLRKEKRPGRGTHCGAVSSHERASNGLEALTVQRSNVRPSLTASGRAGTSVRELKALGSDA